MSFFSNTLYVRVSRNEVRVERLESGRSATVPMAEPLTVPILLEGRFDAARHALRKAFHEVMGGALFALAPVVIMHPLEVGEAARSEALDRALRALALGMGARKVALHFGRELSDMEARKVATQATRASPR